MKWSAVVQVRRIRDASSAAQARWVSSAKGCTEARFSKLQPALLEPGLFGPEMALTGGICLRTLTRKKKGPPASNLSFQAPRNDAHLGHVRAPL